MLTVIWMRWDMQVQNWRKTTKHTQTEELSNIPFGRVWLTQKGAKWHHDEFCRNLGKTPVVVEFKPCGGCTRINPVWDPSELCEHCYDNEGLEEYGGACHNCYYDQ